jgi:hypothetical protein
MEQPSTQRVEMSSQHLPTTPCSVVWSRGHAYVREGTLGHTRWMGVDDRGRAQSLTDADLRRRGWSLTRNQS